MAKTTQSHKKDEMHPCVGSKWRRQHSTRSFVLHLMRISIVAHHRKMCRVGDIGALSLKWDVAIKMLLSRLRTMQKRRQKESNSQRW